MNANLRLDNVCSIGSADIDIARINAVGGVNSSGKSIISKLLYCNLKSQTDNESLDYLMDSENLSGLKGENIIFKSDSFSSEVFYMDNISILDLKDLEILRVDHIAHIKQALEEDAAEVCPQTTEILEKINRIIGDGCLKQERSSSGIKEIGIIQILLQNGRLKRDSFLIIDEPESSLHPAWQIRFAEILVLLACELDIHLYLNSHSPMFIEAISLYSQYYGLLSQTNFYLAEENGDKFDFRRIDAKNMGEVYENLTRPYDELDRVKAKILFKG